jgi:hypothetical protein
VEVQLRVREGRMQRVGFRTAAILIAGSVILVLTAGAASAVNPPGNNGTVKVDGLDIDSIPENAPHQGCIFQIEFRGYDQGNLNATYSLTAQPPTGHGEVVASGTTFIGEDPAGGANDLDATVVINIDSPVLLQLFQQPQQGFHLKLTVHADGSIGNDTKFKVFWVTGCPTYPLQPSQQVNDLPASLQSDAPKSGGIDWAIVGFAAVMAVAVIIVARRRTAAKRP